MQELICHLIGDYILQNHRMAMRKTSSSLWALLHVAFYMVPFLAITCNPSALAIIGGTHFPIDRFRLAKYWVAFWGVGESGWLPDRFSREPIPSAPDFLRVWLLIIADNTMHLTINHAALMWT